jgi:hypothetical protein
VPKKGSDEFHPVADLQHGNKTLAESTQTGFRYYTARDLAMALTWRVIVAAVDMNDGYQISPLTSCTSELVWGWGITAVERDYPDDPDLEPPTVAGADCSFQPAGPAWRADSLRLLLDPACGLLVGLLRRHLRQVL